MAGYHSVSYIRATDNGVTFLVDPHGSSASTKRGTLSTLNIHPGSLGKWLHAYQRTRSLVLEETDAFDAGAIITRRAGIKSPPFGAVKR